MRKLLLPLLAMLSLTSCQKEFTTDNTSEEIAGASANKQTKITICHYDAVTGTSKTMQVTENALAGHLSHGDLQGSCSSVLTTICNQDWMVKNLDVDHYKNGDVIPQVTNQADWASLTTGAWCYANNDPANGAIYGKLYNWYAVNDPRGLGPAGWHVPSETEWTNLSDCLGGKAIAGGKMKSTGTYEAGTGLWYAPNTGATNSSGFNGIPAILRVEEGSFIDVATPHIRDYWWSSTNTSGVFAFFHALFYYNEELYGGDVLFFKQSGFSVRCVRDQTELVIGADYQGGKIAYIYQSGDPGYVPGETHGLIAAASDQSTGAEWGCYPTLLSGADGTALGTGNQNTIDIMAGCATPGIAARLCGDLELNGYSDWYLPSRDELDKLYINQVAIGGFANGLGWSSSENDNVTAWAPYFAGGFQGIAFKSDNRLPVRAVRSF
jgi:uncharacterized protein (TIGR02145 family)